MHPRLMCIVCLILIATIWFAPTSESQISTFPHVQSFDSVTPPGLPSGWLSTQNRTPGTNDFTTSNSTPHSSPNATVSTNATIAQALTSPRIDFRNQVPDRISFHTRRSATHLARVVVEASLDTGATFPIQIGDSLLNPGTTNYVASVFVLPSELAQRDGVKFRWRVVPDVAGTTGNVRIDDVTITVQVSNDLGVIGVRFLPSPPREGDSVDAVALVRNFGLQTATSFDVRFYLDANNDSIPQPIELITSASTLTSLTPGDSVEIPARIGSFTAGRRSIIAEVVYGPDQNFQNDRFLSLLRVGYQPHSIVVNEIMYAPSGTEPEWVELYNARTDTINIVDWLVSDNVVSSRRVIATGNVYVLPQGYILLTRDSAALVDIHPDVPSRIVNVTGFPTLNNSGDAVILYDDLASIMDSTAYLPAWGGNSGGKSLERIDPSGSSTHQANWSASHHPARSTPGRRNSVSRKDHDLALDTLVFSPQFPFQGDSIVAAILIRNPGIEEVNSFSCLLFDDTNNDSIPHPDELVYSVPVVMAIAPLDSLLFMFPPFQPVRNEHSLITVVRFPLDEDSLNNTKIGRTIVGHQRGSMVINEIMYSPVAEPEWIELVNTTADTIDLDGWSVSNRTVTSRYRIAQSAVSIPPGGLAVITKDTALLGQRYGWLPGMVMQSAALPTFLFNNSGDAVVVFDNRELQMDSVRYAPAWGGNNGSSLERIDALSPADDSLNWSSSVDSMRATPGRENSVAALDHDLRIMKVMSVVAPPGAMVAVGVTIRNIGRMESGGYEVALFDDGNRDSIATPEELIARTHVSQTLARGETLHVTLQWPAPPAGIHHAIARVEYAPDLRSGNNSAMFTVTIGFEPRSVVVNEIMFSPLSGDGEYVEVVNAGTEPVDLAGWKLTDRPTVSGLANEFSLATQGQVLLQGQFFVIVSDSSVLARFPHLHGGLLRVANQSSLGLNNDGDAVIIRDPTGATIDSVAYVPSWHYPSITDVTGRSLERISPSLRSNDARSWSSCVLGVGGTPGRVNSIFTSTLVSHAGISCSPNPFSPDGDGVEDFSVIHCDLPAEVAMFNVRVFDVKGRLIRHLVNNEPIGSRVDIVWDGLDDERQRARMGIYVLLVEGLSDRGGAVFSGKGVVVLAAKLR